jgi:S1-C subfamily serine protease
VRKQPALLHWQVARGGSSVAGCVDHRGKETADVSKRRPLYSRSGKPRAGGRSGFAALPATYVLPHEIPTPTVRQRLAAWWGTFYPRHQGKLVIGASALVALGIVGLYDATRPVIPRVSDLEFSAAVNSVVDQRRRPPAPASIAYATVLPSVVRVAGYSPEGWPATNDRWAARQWLLPWFDAIDRPDTIGTGVVIDDKGNILTNWHVAGSQAKLRVTFMDGTESNGIVVGAQPEKDLAVIRTPTIPDDLQPATLAASTTLNPGDEVVAIGFPFGIGPSASDGVVSGLHRAFVDEHKRQLTDLIQFDAAANPGNSGGPLVDADGEVVGIVTAILNPSGARTFVGIGFAMPIESAANAVGENPL